MFLRYGQVVGQAGVIYALVIVAVSKVITTLTALSLSAIATNTEVKGGGAYFLISRSLGVEFGGAIGVVFFLAQAISVAMYVIGFSEALVDTYGSAFGSPVLIATVTNVVVFVCVFIGAGWTIKVQYFILAILGASLVSFFIGAAGDFDPALLRTNLQPSYLAGQNFFTMFALFFPAVTGIMAGANMSGDLRDPGRSIPKGTLAAVAVTAGVYLLQAVLLGGSRSSDELIGNNLIIKEIAWSGSLITAGVFAATLSSALGSMMGSPRILQALARDDVFPFLKFFGSGSGKSVEPRRATVVTFVIAQTCILLGDLNAIAPVITMFFMITYGTLNLATFYEAITKNPSYRPRFRFSHWSTSLLGAIACLSVMFLIDWVWAIVSLVLMAGLCWYVSLHEIEVRWGNMQSGLKFERTRRNLLKLEAEMYHPKNWRPIILALSGGAWTRPHLAVYGHWLSAGHGILTLSQIISGEVEDRLAQRTSAERMLRSFIEKQKLEAFPAVVVAPFVSDGIESLVQCHGIGGLRPNTVLLGWPNDSTKSEIFGANLRLISQLDRSIVALRLKNLVGTDDFDDSEPVHDDPWKSPSGTIDVWWRGHKNGQLMLLLAYLLTLNPEWRHRTIRLLRAVDNETAAEEVEKHLVKLSEESRIAVEASTIVVAEGTDVATTIQTRSRFSAIVIIGFEAPDEGCEREFFESIESIAGNLPRVILVDSAGGMELNS
ncbi:MAG: amino acid permease [Rhodopirellula sp.]|nr:amino acid permease [Rhodopirellula sp.]